MARLPKIRMVHQHASTKVARVPSGGAGRAKRLNVSPVGQQPNKTAAVSGGGGRGKG